MTAKELLREIHRIETFIETKKQRVDTMKALASSPQSPNFSGMPRNPSPSTSKLADIMCKALDLEAEIYEDERRLQEKKLYVLDLIGSLECADHQSVLIKRYFEKQSWDNIAASMFYTTRWIYKLHGAALVELDRRIGGAQDEL